MVPWTKEQLDTLSFLVTNFKKPSGQVNWKRVQTEAKEQFESLQRHQYLCQQKASNLGWLKPSSTKGKPRIKRRVPKWLQPAYADSAKPAPQLPVPARVAPAAKTNSEFGNNYCRNCGCPVS